LVGVGQGGCGVRGGPEPKKRSYEESLNLIQKEGGTCFKDKTSRGHVFNEKIVIQKTIGEPKKEKRGRSILCEREVGKFGRRSKSTL